MIKIKGENNNTIELEVKELNLQDRARFNNLYHKAEVSSPLDWSMIVQCCQFATKFTDDELNEFTDVDIILIAKECYFKINKKKLKK